GMTKRWSESELRGLIEAFGNPMIIARDGRILAVNEAWLAALGFAREAVEGADYLSFIPPEELHHIAEQTRRRRDGLLPDATSLQVNALDSRGVRHPFILNNRVLKAADGGADFVITSCAEVPGGARDLELAECLVKVAANLVARTEELVREKAIRGFEQAGIVAALYRANRHGALDPLLANVELPPPSVDLAREAFVEGRPVYVLNEGKRTFQIFVPVVRADADSELLVLWDSRFQTPHLSLLKLFSQQLAAALESTRIFMQLQDRNDELQLMLDLARTTSGTLDLATILDVACDFLVKLLDVSNCFIMLVDRKTQVLRAAASSTTHRQFFRGVVIPLASESVAALAASRGVPVAVEDTERSGSFRQDLVERFGEKAILALPLTTRHELIGSVVLDDTRGPRKFNEEFVSLALATVGQLALSVHNAQLYESLKESYAQLAETRAEMVKQERLAALGELSAIVAHEVRNPLGVIFNAVASLRRLNRTDSDAGMLLDIVKEEADRLNRIVSDLLDFSRPTELALDSEDLDTLVRESVSAALLGQGQGEASWDVVMELDPSLPRVAIDRRLFRQALINLLANAMQAMPRGGRVFVQSRLDGPEAVRVAIRDEGPGVPEEVRSRIFEPFFTTKAKGTGLGLAVVKRIVEDHKGEVTLDSKPGEGATFTIRLPVPRRAGEPAVLQKVSP
ncbi:MAG: ATP-binding protein, partial [Myxococcaceae bacterium]